MKPLPETGRHAKSTQSSLKLTTQPAGAERRDHRRYDLGGQTLSVSRWDGRRRQASELGYIMDVSAGGVRVRMPAAPDIRPDSQVRVRLEMPSYAGICPFIDTTHVQPRPKNEWIGWLAVSLSASAEEKEQARLVGAQRR